MNRSLRCVDGIVVGYLVGTGLLLLPGATSAWVYPLCMGLHAAVAIAIVRVGRLGPLPPVLQTIRETYPLLLLLLLYGEVDLLVGLWHAPPGFDALVRAWDLWLFGGHPHLYLDQVAAGWAWRELFHFLYLAYYLLLIGSFLGVWQKKPQVFPRFAFVVTGVFASFVAIFIAFPVAGPLSSPEASLPRGGFFPEIVAHLYAPLSADGIHAGAFPSSHVGMSVAIVLLLAPRRWWSRCALGLLVLGIALSTVYGRFHYAIDAVAGLLAGGVLYLVWTRIHDALRPAESSLLGDESADGQPRGRERSAVVGGHET